MNQQRPRVNLIIFNKKTIVCLIFFFRLGTAVNSVQINEKLIQCYRGNETIPWMASSMHTLIELIRKIEDALPTSLNIRQLSVSLIHDVRIDGIVRDPSIRETQFITPFRANGEMVHKFELLLKLISKTPGNIEFDQILTTAELCQLHRLLSMSVQPYERGDESRTCPLTVNSPDSNENRNWWTHRNRCVAL